MSSDPLPRPSSARRGLPGYAAGCPGFYVVNPRTNIAVAVHASRENAEADGASRDAAYPNDGLKLVVVEVSSRAF